MRIDTDQRHKCWTAAQLSERFGAMPLWRIVHDPLPGLATEQDVIRLEQENRLCEPAATRRGGLMPLMESADGWRGPGWAMVPSAGIEQKQTEATE